MLNVDSRGGNRAEHTEIEHILDQAELNKANFCDQLNQIVRLCKSTRTLTFRDRYDWKVLKQACTLQLLVLWSTYITSMGN